jgi:mercuric ion transport protein
MDSHHAPSRRAYAWGTLTALACPCHLPLLAVVLAGTTAGAALAKHLGIAALALAALFLLALTRAVLAFRSRP